MTVDYSDLARQSAEVEEQLTARKAEMFAWNENIGDRDLTPGEAERWHNLERGFEKLKEKQRKLRDEFRTAVSTDPTIERSSGRDAPDAERSSRQVDRSRDGDVERGRRAIDANFALEYMPAESAERAFAVLDSGIPAERSLAGRWAAAAGNLDYRDAFAALLADPERGHLTWTQAQQHAYREVAKVHGEMRAMALTPTTSGGYMVPLTLDPAIMLSNVGSISPLRQLATVKQTLTNSWAGVTSAGATAEWKDEAAEAGDGSPVLARPEIPVFLGDSFVPYSFEVGMDGVGFLDEIAVVLADAAANLAAQAYVTGGGTNNPAGLVTGLIGGGSEINTSGNEAVDVTDPYRLQADLGARFSPNATWLSHIAIANEYRKMVTNTTGAYAFPELRDFGSPSMLGKRWHECSHMDGSINVSATANNYVLVYGDLRQGFTIVDRVGATLELIPNLFGNSGRPTGQRGALLWFRTGSKVTRPEALRILDVPTTA